MGPLHPQPSHCSRDQRSASVWRRAQHGLTTTPADQCTLCKHEQGRKHPHVIQQQASNRCNPILLTIHCSWRPCSWTPPCTGLSIPSAAVLKTKTPLGLLPNTTVTRQIPDVHLKWTKGTCHSASCARLHYLLHLCSMHVNVAF